MKGSLYTRLTLGFLIAILATVTVVVLLVTVITVNRFTYIMSFSGQRHARRLVPVFAEYYSRVGSWNGVERLLAFDNKQPQPPKKTEGRWPRLLPTLNKAELGNDRVLLLDIEGQIVADSDPEGNRVSLTSRVLERGHAVVVNEETVGNLLVLSGLGEWGAVQSAFLRQMRLLMIVAGVVAVVVGLVISGFQARGIIAPVRALVTGTRRVAAGDFSQRIPVTSDDELGELAAAFNTMASELATQQDLRRRAMTDIAHELRTPLSVLQIELESIEDGLTEPTTDVVTGLQAQVAHLNHLVEDLRVLSLTDADELSLEAVAIDIRELVDDVTRRVRAAAVEKEISIAADIPDTPLIVTGDAQRLSQVLLNLLSNALRHTASGGEITVITRRALEAGEVWVSVQDTGEGIPAAELSLVFERFYRVDRARSGNGTGLGLSIARSLIEAHGGRMWVESVEGVGSTFTFALPAA